MLLTTNRLGAEDSFKTCLGERSDLGFINKYGMVVRYLASDQRKTLMLD